MFKKGFTLIELLVVMFIIGLLASIVTINVNIARQKARDSKRISDMDTLRNTLEMYNNRYGHYPATGSTVSMNSVANGSKSWIPCAGGASCTPASAYLTPDFIAIIPNDPINTAVAGQTQYYYNYISDSNGKDYKMYVQSMESTEGQNRGSTDGGNLAVYEVFSNGAKCWTYGNVSSGPNSC